MVVDGVLMWTCMCKMLEVYTLNLSKNLIAFSHRKKIQ